MCWADLDLLTKVCIIVSEKVHMQELEKIEQIVQGNDTRIRRSLIIEMLVHRGILWNRNLFLSYQGSLYYILTSLDTVKTLPRAKKLASDMMNNINPLYPHFKDFSSKAYEF
jgi:hypothetical protein